MNIYGFERAQSLPGYFIVSEVPPSGVTKFVTLEDYSNKVRQLMKVIDDALGTPCEQIRKMQEDEVMK